MERNKDRLMVMMLLIAAIISLLAMTAYRVSAQSIVTTMFKVDCVEAISPTHYRLHFGYHSTGVDKFSAGLVNTGAGVTVKYDSTFTTSKGDHIEWYLEAAYTNTTEVTMAFSSLTQWAMMPLSRVNVPDCVSVQSVVIPTDEPDVELSLTSEPTDDCPAWSVESATGDMICLWDLPRVGEW